MIYEVMRYCKNFFPYGETVSGTWVISGGRVNLPFLKEGQYFFIESSFQNDGVYMYPDCELVGDVLEGYITPLSPPKEFIKLCEDISMWQEKYGGVDSSALSPFNSESFGGYSYSKGGGNSSSGQVGTSWKDVFKGRLREWRKI